MGPLREAMASLNLTMGLPSAGQRQSQGFPAQQQQQQQPQQRNVYTVVAVLGVAQKPKPCVMIEIQLPPSHRTARMTSGKEREEFWSDHGRGTLPLDALVCIVVRGTAAAAGSGIGVSSGDTAAAAQPPIVMFATVGRRDPKELAGQTPVIGISFDRGQGVEQVLQLLGQGRLRDVSLVQVSPG